MKRMRSFLRGPLLCIATGLLIGNCSEPYLFETNAQTGLLIVDGMITDEPGPYFLNLATTTASNIPPEPVIGASAYVTDDIGNTYLYQQIDKGKYRTIGTQGMPGVSYTLHVTLADGRKFESNAQKIPSVAKPKDSTYVTTTRQDVINENGIELKYWYVNNVMNTRLAENTKGYYRWAVSEMWAIFPTCLPGSFSCPKICYISEPVSTYNLIVVKSADFSNSEIKNLQLMKRGVDFSFNARHYFISTQYSMNEEAYNYWAKVAQLITKRGSIFDTPPSIIRGNVKNFANSSELVLGFFEASGSKLTRAYIDKGRVPTYVESCYYYDPDYNPFLFNRFCFYCENHAGATIEEPAWFWK